jgi:hypothetical protein
MRPGCVVSPAVVVYWLGNVGVDGFGSSCAISTSVPGRCSPSSVFDTVLRRLDDFFTPNHESTFDIRPDSAECGSTAAGFSFSNL